MKEPPRSASVPRPSENSNPSRSRTPDTTRDTTRRARPWGDEHALPRRIDITKPKTRKARWARGRPKGAYGIRTRVRRRGRAATAETPPPTRALRVEEVRCVANNMLGELAPRPSARARAPRRVPRGRPDGDSVRSQPRPPRAILPRTPRPRPASSGHTAERPLLEGSALRRGALDAPPRARQLPRSK
jgi:hypothetical protein